MRLCCSLDGLDNCELALKLIDFEVLSDSWISLLLPTNNSEYLYICIFFIQKAIESFINSKQNEQTTCPLRT